MIGCQIIALRRTMWCSHGSVAVAVLTNWGPVTRGCKAIRRQRIFRRLEPAYHFSGNPCLLSTVGVRMLMLSGSLIDVAGSDCER